MLGVLLLLLVGVSPLVPVPLGLDPGPTLVYSVWTLVGVLRLSLLLLLLLKCSLLALIVGLGLLILCHLLVVGGPLSVVLPALLLGPAGVRVTLLGLAVSVMVLGRAGLRLRLGLRLCVGAVVVGWLRLVLLVLLLLLLLLLSAHDRLIG